MYKFQNIFFIFFLSLSVNSQVLNTDRIMVSDTLIKKISGNVDISFTSDKVKNNVLDGSSKIELFRFFKNNYFIVASLINDFTLNGKDVLQNEGFIQVRLRDNDSREWSIELYIQNQWNGALGMKYRNVVGNNLRKRFFEKKKFDLYSGLGTFYEIEEWNWDGVENLNNYENTPNLKRTLLRLNHYWKVAYKFNDNVDISAITYFQFPLNQNFINLRWFFDLNTYVKMTKKTSFIIHFDSTYDTYRMVPISDFYYSFNFGIQYTW